MTNARPGRTNRVKVMAIACASFLIASAAQAQLELAHFLTVDVPTATVDGSFLSNGVPFSADYGNLGLLHLAHPGDASPIPIGLTADQIYGPRVVISGSYTPTYEYLFSSGEIPVNPRTVVGASAPLSSSSTLDVDVASIDVTFDFTLNGGAFSVNASESGQILLRDVASGLEFPVGTTASLPFVVKIIPGTYDIIYSHLSGSVVPQNEHAVIEPARSILTSQTVTTNIATSYPGLNFLLNGAPFSSSGYLDGEIFLRNFATGDSVSYGLTSDGAGAIRKVILGTYDVTWTWDSGDSLVPVNSNAVVVEGLIINTPGLSVSDVDVQAAYITLDATLNGGAFPTSAYIRGEIVLVGPHGDEAKLGETDIEFPDPVLVVLGSYDLHYRWLAGSSVTPRNPNACLLTNVHVSQDATLSIDVPTVRVTPAFTLDGAAFPGSAYVSADFTLVGELEGDVIPIGSSHESPSGVQIVPGVYDVVYDWNAGATVVPKNRNHTVRVGVELSSRQTLDVDIATKAIVPTFLLDGLPFPNAAGERGDIVLRSIAGGELDLGPSNVAVPASVRGIQGFYAVEYDWVSGVAVPRNVGHRLGFTTVPEPDLVRGVVAGALTLLTLGSSRRRPVPGDTSESSTRT